MRPFDADAVKDVIAELNENGYDISPSAIAFVRNILLRMPTIEPKKGKLTHVGYDCGLKIYECSECHKRTYGRTNYCPNCGAQIVVSDNDVGKIERIEE